MDDATLSGFNNHKAVWSSYLWNTSLSATSASEEAVAATSNNHIPVSSLPSLLQELQMPLWALVKIKLLENKKKQA